MRISIGSTTRVERLKHTLHDVLKDEGVDTTLSKASETLGLMLGYSGWTELALATQDKGRPLSPYDEKISASERHDRIEYQAKALMWDFDMDRKRAIGVVSGVRASAHPAGPHHKTDADDPRFEPRYNKGGIRYAFHDGILVDTSEGSVSLALIDTSKDNVSMTSAERYLWLMKAGTLQAMDYQFTNTLRRLAGEFTGLLYDVTMEMLEKANEGYGMVQILEGMPQHFPLEIISYLKIADYGRETASLYKAAALERREEDWRRYRAS